MAEIINKDLLLKVLRYLYMVNNLNMDFDMDINVRQSTIDVVFSLLIRDGFIDKNGALTPKGIAYLRDRKLDIPLLTLTHTPYGVSYDSANVNHSLQKLLKFLKRRPKPNYELDHQPLLPHLTLMRAYYIVSRENLFNKNIAMIGDYDSVSLAINLLSLPRNTTVFDIDVRLLSFFSEIADENNFSMNLINHDIFTSPPSNECGKYDVFVTDPPYAMKGMFKFIDFAITLLKNGGVGYIAVPFHENIGWTERMIYEVNKLLITRNCVVTTVIDNFHSYQTADGLKSSLIRIKKGVVTYDQSHNKLYSYKKININKPVVQERELL